MDQKGLTLAFLIVGFAGFSLLCSLSCSDESQQVYKKKAMICQSINDVIRVVARVKEVLKDDSQLDYQRIKKYFGEENGYRIDEKRIIKGNWVQVNKNTAVVRSLHVNMFSFFDKYGEWYDDKSKAPELITASQPYTNAYILIRGREVIDLLNLDLDDKCKDIQIVIWLKKYILNVDLSEGILEITNRGS
jgi:hypothetical protein